MSLLAKAVERFVVRNAPYRLCAYNGVAVRPGKLWDRQGDYPGYEEELVRGIRREVATGDSVVVIGGGLGVSSVVAARAVGAAGDVVTFEAVGRLVERVRETVSLNRMANRVTVEHAVVETFAGGDAAAEMYGVPDGAVIEVADLPVADVLVIDAEGAETSILPGLEAVPCGLPRAIVVESHGFLGAPTDDVHDDLEALGYNVELLGYEREDRDVAVLLGTQEDQP